MKFSAIVVDDDEIFILLLKKILQTSKFHPAPIGFNSAEKAMHLIAELPDNTMPVVLFLDINMPEISGWDLLNIIDREDFDREIYVVMVTSSIDPTDRERAFTYSKVIDFVAKPVKMSFLENLKQQLPWFKVMP